LLQYQEKYEYFEAGGCSVTSAATNMPGRFNDGNNILDIIFDGDSADDIWSHDNTYKDKALNYGIYDFQNRAYSSDTYSNT
jgi:hypothetical protein